MVTELETTQANFAKVKTEKLQQLLNNDRGVFDETSLNVMRDELRSRGFAVSGGFECKPDFNL